MPLVLQHLLGFCLPILIGEVWPGPDRLRPFAAYAFFACVAGVARFFGFGPAVSCSVAAALTLWHVVLAASSHSAAGQLGRLLLFFAAALTIASVSQVRVKEARMAERRMTALFERAIDPIVFFDDEGRYVDANPAAAELFGIPQAEIVKRAVGDFSLPEKREQLREMLRRLRVEGSVTGEWLIARADGSRREIEYRAVANILPGVHCFLVHDVTDRKEVERSMRQLSGRLLQLQDEERARIARQLHETTAQSLAAIRLHLVRVARSAAAADPATKEAIEESVALTEQSISEIRTLSYLLHPPMIEQVGLVASLRWYVRGFESRSGITTALETPDDLGRLPREIETAVFRIVQESLTNIQRHSGSNVARVRIESQDETIRLSVEDEGRGLPLHVRGDANAIRSAGVGLAGIDQRARELGGSMTVASDDHGTRVEATLPIRG